MFAKFKKTRKDGGQALIVVLLVMAVILTSALSITSRSTLDVTSTTYEADALRAFSAAEAGVEKALLSDTSIPETNIDSGGRVRYEAPIVTANAGAVYRYPVNLNSGDVATVWFVSHNAATGELICNGSNVCTRANSIDVCWGDGTLSGTDRPAIQFSIYKDLTKTSSLSPNNFSSVQVATVTADPDTTRAGNTGFATATTCPSNLSSEYPHGMSLNNPQLNSLLGVGCSNSPGGGCLVMAKVRMLYNPVGSPQPVLFRVSGGNATLPAQGYEIQSTGTAGESTRKVNVLRLWPEPQSVFNNAIFSYNNLIK